MVIQMADYIIPNFLARLLSKPSPRTQMESSLVGILVMMLGSLAVSSYLVINNIVQGFWFKSLVITSALGLLSFQFSMLSTTYQTYREYKMANKMYPIPYQLKIKLEQAESIRKELLELETKLKQEEGVYNVL
jgi:hypothetical protein